MRTFTVDATAQFVTVWSSQDTAHAVAPTLQCVEVDTLLDLLRAAGATNTTIACWLDAHADSESECQGHSAPAQRQLTPRT